MTRAGRSAADADRCRRGRSGRRQKPWWAIHSSTNGSSSLRIAAKHTVSPVRSDFLDRIVELPPPCINAAIPGAGNFRIAGPNSRMKPSSSIKCQLDKTFRLVPRSMSAFEAFSRHQRVVRLCRLMTHNGHPAQRTAMAKYIFQFLYRTADGLTGGGRAPAQVATTHELSVRLHAEQIGAMVVSSDGKSIDGIITERDLVYGLAAHGSELPALAVSSPPSFPRHTGHCNHHAGRGRILSSGDCSYNWA